MRALSVEELGFVSGGEVVVVWGPPSSSGIGNESAGTQYAGTSPINYWGAGAGLLGDVALEVLSSWLAGDLNKTRPSQSKATEIRSGVQNNSMRYIGKMSSPSNYGNNNTTSVYRDTFGNAFFLLDEFTDGSFEAVIMRNTAGQSFQWSGSGWDPLD